MKKLLGITLGLVVILNLLVGLPVEAAESAFDSGDSGSAFDSASSSVSPEDASLNWSGSLELDIRSILDKEDVTIVSARPDLDLDLSYDKDNSKFAASLNFADGSEDVVSIEEAVMRLYYDNFDLVVGKKKEVWGKGDKLHVVDNLNGEDLTDFINPDYLDRQIGQEMIKLNSYLGTGTLETVYTPNFTPDQLAQEGIWVPQQVEKLNNLESVLVAEFGEFDAKKVKSTLQDNPHDEFSDGQLALRYTDSQAGYDYGFSFYQGYLKRPSMDQRAIGKLKADANPQNPNPSNYDGEYKAFLEDLDYHYDRVSVLGAEFSSVLAGINSRGEVAYYLTDDSSGDDPTVHNHKLAWLIGGDRDLPVHNLSLNLQVKSEYILDDEQIEDNQFQGKNIDVDYNQHGDYFTNLVSVELADEFKNETILPSLTVVYNLETDDLVLDTGVEYELQDDTSLELTYKNYSGDADTDFGQFAKNDYLSAQFEYDF